MKVLCLIAIALTMELAQALTFSALAHVSLTLMSLNAPAYGVFGIFRRRQPPAHSMVEEQSFGPSGPVQFPSAGFQQDASRSFFGRRFMSGFPSIPSFPGGMFQATESGQFWPFPSSGNAPRPQAQVVSKPVADVSQDDRVQSDQPQINTEEAESFFTLLAETDENQCISRLVCEMGADPSDAGELGIAIRDIIGSLTDFPSGSRTSEYNKVLREGLAQGKPFCASRYSTCDEESYALMKNAQNEQTTEDIESS